MHAPLNAVIRFGKKAGERLIPVKLGARLTEIGTLETWCESKISDNRWRLQFELRKAAAEPAERKPAAVIGEQALSQALELVPAVFSPGAKSPIPPEELPARLEQILGLGKNSWPLAAIRQLADVFLAARRRPQEESGLRGALAEPVRLLPASRASAIRVTIGASSRPAASTPPVCSMPTRCSAKSTGGSSGDAWQAD